MSLAEIWQGEMRQNQSFLVLLFEKRWTFFHEVNSSQLLTYFAELMRYGKQGLLIK